eukprot:gene8144-5677_t
MGMRSGRGGIVHLVGSKRRIGNIYIYMLVRHFLSVQRTRGMSLWGTIFDRLHKALHNAFEALQDLLQFITPLDCLREALLDLVLQAPTDFLAEVADGLERVAAPAFAAPAFPGILFTGAAAALLFRGGGAAFAALRASAYLARSVRSVAASFSLALQQLALEAQMLKERAVGDTVAASVGFSIGAASEGVRLLVLPTALIYIYIYRERESRLRREQREGGEAGLTRYYPSKGRGDTQMTTNTQLKKKKKKKRRRVESCLWHGVAISHRKTQGAEPMGLLTGYSAHFIHFIPLHRRQEVVLLTPNLDCGERRERERERENERCDDRLNRHSDHPSPAVIRVDTPFMMRGVQASQQTATGHNDIEEGGKSAVHLDKDEVRDIRERMCNELLGGGPYVYGDLALSFFLALLLIYFFPRLIENDTISSLI